MRSVKSIMRRYLTETERGYKMSDVSRPKKRPSVYVSRCVHKVFDILIPVHIHSYQLKCCKQRDNVVLGKKWKKRVFQCVQREFQIFHLDTKTREFYKGKMLKTDFVLLKREPGHISVTIIRFKRIRIDVSESVPRTQKEG